MQGLLEQADGGTLFLDEIGDMPLPLQTRLLRVLAEGEVAPLGASRSRAIDLQVICASHRDLEGLVAAGEFREDLYFRLNGARFQLPPLRERTDRLALINRILAEESTRCAEPMQLGGAALECLLGYRWPGNVRQLRNVLRYACAVCDSNLIQVSHLPEQLRITDLMAPPLMAARARNARRCSTPWSATAGNPPPLPRRWAFPGQPCIGGCISTASTCLAEARCKAWLSWQAAVTSAHVGPFNRLALQSTPPNTEHRSR